MKFNENILNIRRRVSSRYRKVTCKMRALPDFIIIGAMKSGTKSLFTYLAQHPMIVPPFQKEVHYFDGGTNPNHDNFKRGINWYRLHFPLNMLMQKGYKTFEASPLYIFNPLAPKRIHGLLPNVKLIVLLRNPTERAISHYFHERRKGREQLPIEEALKIEEERLKPVIERNDYKSTKYIHYSYKKRGLYKIQIEQYLKIFPRKNLLILKSEDFFNETEKHLKIIYDFIGVNSNIEIENLHPQNVGTNKTEVDQNIIDYLNNYFFPHNQELYELLGESFDW